MIKYPPEGGVDRLRRLYMTGCFVEEDGSAPLSWVSLYALPINDDLWILM